MYYNIKYGDHDFGEVSLDHAAKIKKMEYIKDVYNTAVGRDIVESTLVKNMALLASCGDVEGYLIRKINSAIDYEKSMIRGKIANIRKLKAARKEIEEINEGD